MTAPRRKAADAEPARLTTVADLFAHLIEAARATPVVEASLTFIVIKR
jgi:hypothetical protein